MKVQTGETGLINFVAVAAVLSGAGLIFGTLFGVVQADTAIGETGVLDTRDGNSYILPKLSADVMSAGDQVHWNTATSEFQLTGAVGTWPVGKVVDDAGAAVLTVNVRIQQAAAAN